MNLPIEFSVEDVQNTPDVRMLAIDQVGIKALRHPVSIRDRSGNVQHTVATFNMYVYLSQHFKGTHMSRFVELLNANEGEFTVGNFQELLNRTVDRLDAESGSIEMHFPFFVKKSAPISGVQSLMDYEVSILGEIREGHSAVTLKVLIPVTSLCPCSKKIADYGAHNQRSHVTITAQLAEFIEIEDLIDLVEEQASSQLYGLLKRPDEKFVTEYAYDHPKFVEDMVRDVATELAADSRIGKWVVECENFESIHNHSAYAVIKGGRAA